MCKKTKQNSELESGELIYLIIQLITVSGVPTIGQILTESWVSRKKQSRDGFCHNGT